MDEYLPLREVVFEALRDAIVHGEFEPGERLLEVALAKRLGVSRTPDCFTHRSPAGTRKTSGCQPDSGA